MLKVLEDTHSFYLGGTTVDVELAELLCVGLRIWSGLIYRSERGEMGREGRSEWEQGNEEQGGGRKEKTYLESKYVIRKDDNFIPPILMIPDQKLTGLKLFGIHAIKQHSLSRFFPQILAIEFGRHGTPNFCALWDVSNCARGGEEVD